MQRVLVLPPGAPTPRTSHYSPMLHNAMLSLATAFSDDPAVLNIEFRRHFATKAKSYIDVDVLQPSVCTVSALGLMATFHSSRGEQSLGYLYAGELYGWLNETVLMCTFRFFFTRDERSHDSGS